MDSIDKASLLSADGNPKNQEANLNPGQSKGVSSSDLFNIKFLRATVILEFSSSLKAVLQFNEPATRTSGWLFAKLIQRLRGLTEDPSVQSKIDTIVALKTKNQNLLADVLLTMDDCPLSFLEKHTLLVPYFGASARYCEESITPLIGVKDFEFVKSLGYGGFSKVFLARKKDTGKFYAVKQINKNESTNQPSYVINERDMLLEAPEAFFSTLKFSFQTTDSYYLIMKFYIGGDLHNYILQRKNLTEKKAKEFFAQLLAGLDILHKNKIIFRDLKPENVLIDERGHLNFADLGFCKKVNEEDLPLTTICGTLEFMAPELLSKQGYDFRADFYSLGVVLFEMLTGAPPFTRTKLSRACVEFEILNTIPSIPNHLTKDCKDILAKLLLKDPDERLGAKKGTLEIMEHPWLQDINFKLVAERKFPQPTLPHSNWNGKTKSTQIFVGSVEEPNYKSRLRRFSFRCEDLPERENYSGPSRHMSSMSDRKKPSFLRTSLNQNSETVSMDSRMKYLPSPLQSSQKRKRSDGTFFATEDFSGSNNNETSPRASLRPNLLSKDLSSRLVEFVEGLTTRDCDDDIGDDDTVTLLDGAKSAYNFKSLVKMSINNLSKGDIKSGTKEK